jgi:hypothetical protein
MDSHGPSIRGRTHQINRRSKIKIKSGKKTVCFLVNVRKKKETIEAKQKVKEE